MSCGSFAKRNQSNVHGWRSLDRLDARHLAQAGEAAVRGDGERSAQLVPRIIGAEIFHAAHHAVFFHQLAYVGAHHQTEARELGGFSGDEVEKPHLRNH